MQSMEEKMEKTIYYISEAAQKVQVESHVLRYWEDELKLPIHRNEMGHRCYTKENIEQLQEIKALKEQGLQLKAIKAIIDKGEDHILNKAQKYIVSLSKDSDPDKTVIYPIGEDGTKDVLKETGSVSQAAALQEKVKAMKELDQREKETAAGKKAPAGNGTTVDKKPETANGQAAGNGQASGKELEAVKGQAAEIEPDTVKKQATGNGQVSGREEETAKKQPTGDEWVSGRETEATRKQPVVNEQVPAKEAEAADGRSIDKMMAGGDDKNTLLCAAPQTQSAQTTVEAGPGDPINEKAARLQLLLQHMITDAVRTANRELCSDVKESILKELDYQFRMQEERDDERWKKEEEHYRRIDEMIRERHGFKDKSKKDRKKSPISF